MKSFWVTFYSYKGGVGRSLALANTAAKLAQEGRRVLMVDFDLEAPGLDAFEEFNIPKNSAGMVEYVSEYRQSGVASPVSDFVREVKSDEIRRGKLWLMTSGRKDSNYNQKRADINWSDFYEKERGELFFENFKADIENSFSPDYVFVDSRTGLTDVGGVCTAHLPDLVVLLFSLNEQNLQGIASVAKVLKNSDRKPQLIPVATPVPNMPRDSKSMLDDRFARAKELLGTNVELSIAYSSQVALREKIYTWGSGTPLVYQYDELKKAIRHAAPEGIDYLIQQAQHAIENFDLELAEDIAVSLVNEYGNRADAWQTVSDLRKIQGDIGGYESALCSSLDLDPGNTFVYERLYNLLIAKKRTADLINITQGLLARDERYSPEEGDKLTHRLGILLMQIQNYAQAKEVFERRFNYQMERLDETAPSIEWLVPVFNVSEAERRLGIIDTEGWKQIVTTFEAFAAGIQTDNLPGRMNQLQAMHIAYACTGYTEVAIKLLQEVEKIAQQISSKERIFCVATYRHEPLDTFLEQNSKMLDALSRNELWDGMQLPQ